MRPRNNGFKEILLQIHKIHKEKARDNQIQGQRQGHLRRPTPPENSTSRKINPGAAGDTKLPHRLGRKVRGWEGPRLLCGHDRPIRLTSVKDVRARKLHHLFSELVLIKADAAGAVRLLGQVKRCDLPTPTQRPTNGGSGNDRREREQADNAHQVWRVVATVMN